MRYIFKAESLKSPIFLIVLLVAGILSAGCVKLDRPSLDRKYFTLDIERSSIPVAKIKSGKNLVVRRVKVSPRYEDRDLVYKTGKNMFESDYYNSFFIPPAALITQELRGWMTDSRLFRNVLGPESMGTGEYLLEGVVNSIYGDYSGDQPKAVLNMQFFLLDNSSPDMPIIYSRDFSREISVDGTGAGDLIAAMNSGVEAVFIDLEKDLARIVEANGK